MSTDAKTQEEPTNIQKSTRPSWVDQEDARKLHAEINQLSNQRVVLTTFAMTVFLTGNVAIIKTSSILVDMRLYEIFSVILNVFLFIMYYLSDIMRHVSRCEATYLIEKKFTNWEQPWRVFREDKGNYSGLAVAQVRIFTILILIESVLHILVYYAYSNKPVGHFPIRDKVGFFLPTAIGFMFLLGSWLFRRAHAKKENRAQATWKSILSDNYSFGDSRVGTVTEYTDSHREVSVGVPISVPFAQEVT